MKMKRNPFQILSVCILSCVVISSGMFAANAVPDDEDPGTVTEYSENVSSEDSDTEDESAEESSTIYEESSSYEESSYYYEESSETWSDAESNTWTSDYYDDDTDDGEFSYIDDYDYENTSSEEETEESSSESGTSGDG